MTWALRCAKSRSRTYSCSGRRWCPGTVEDVLRPIIEAESGKKDGVDFHVCFQPEFLREGTSIRDYDKPPFTVVGANAPEPAAKLRELFGHLPCEFHVTSIRAAEMVKYSCNNFHALKITFANETARLCDALGVDPFEVMDLVCKDRQLNISPAYLKPGFAFGGSCLPKDLRATIHLAKTHDVELPMQAAIATSNRAHIDLAIAKVAATAKRRIGMIGLSFKTGTDDLRESPLVLLAEHFIGKGCTILVYDPEVHLSNLLGANRRYIEQHLPHIGSLIRSDIAAVIAGSDVLVVGLGDRRRRRRPREAHPARADDHRPDQHCRSQGVARRVRGIVLVNPGVLIIANVIALAVALAWLAYLTLPYAQAVRVRNAFLLRRGTTGGFQLDTDGRSRTISGPSGCSPPNAIRGAVESAGIAKLAGDWPRALVLVQMLVQHSQR